MSCTKNALHFARSRQEKLKRNYLFLTRIGCTSVVVTGTAQTLMKLTWLSSALAGPLPLEEILCHPPRIPFGVRMKAELPSLTDVP